MTLVCLVSLGSYSWSTTGCLVGVDDLLDHDMSNSVLLKVFEVGLCRSADLWDWGVNGGRFAVCPFDGAEGRVDLNVGGADGFNGNVEGIHAYKFQSRWNYKLEV